MAGAPNDMPRRIGDIVGFRITFRLPIFIALVIILFALTAVYALIPSLQEVTTFIALALTAVATIGGTFYIAETLRAQSAQEQERARQEKQIEDGRLAAQQKAEEARAVEQKTAHAADAAYRQRTEALTFMARWNNPEFFRVRSTCYEVLDEYKKPVVGGGQAVCDLLEKDKGIAETARNVLNFLEELAIAVRVQHVDETITKAAFRSLVARLWEAFQAWINQHRTRAQSQDIWREFEELYTRWK